MPISEMNRAYGVSQSNLMNVVNRLVDGGLQKSTRGRSGGGALARKSGSAKWRASWKAMILWSILLGAARAQADAIPAK